MRRVVGDYVVELFGKEESNKEFLIKQSKIRGYRDNKCFIK